MTMEGISHYTFPMLEDSVMEKLSLNMSDLGEGEKLRDILEEYGMAIVNQVAPPAELKRLQALFGRDLASLIDTKALTSSCPSSSSLIERIERCLAAEAGKETKEDEDFLSIFPDLWPTGSRVGGRSFAIAAGIPQGHFAWGCRTNPNIRKVFASIHSLPENELCVGMDTAFYTNPALPEAQESNKLWPHADLNLAVPQSGEWPVYQSLLYIQGSNLSPGRSTTVIWPKSHTNDFTALMSDPGVQSRGQNSHQHYSPISDMSNPDNAAQLNAQYLNQARRIPVPPGSLLVWSSRTIHQGHAGGRRLAMPVCWEPLSRRPSSTLQRKLRMVIMGHATTHSAALGDQHPHQPMSHSLPPPPSGEEELKKWVDHVEGELKKGEGEGVECKCFNDTVLPRFTRVAPGCLLKGKGEEYEELEREVGKGAGEGYVGVDGNEELCKKIRSLFNDSASAL